MKIRSTFLKNYMGFPEKAVLEATTELPRIETKPMAFGTIMHAKILEQKNLYVEKQPRIGREFDINEDGLYMVNHATINMIEAMDAMASGVFADIFKKKSELLWVEKDLSCDYNFGFENHELTAKPDLYDSETKTMYDYKTIADTGWRTCANDWAWIIRHNKWHVQMAHYAYVLENACNITTSSWQMVVQVKTFPYTVAVLEFSKDLIEEAKKVHISVLEEFCNAINEKDVIIAPKHYTC